MEYPKYFNPKNSLKLFGFKKDLNILLSLYLKKKLPKILMLSGNKGCGKSTLINHFLFSIFAEKKYDNNNFELTESSGMFKQFRNGIFQNIIYVKGSDFKSVKVDDIRSLKSQILHSSIIDKHRFVILDDIELFNINSLNALLKIIEEPGNNNYFVLINNKTKPLLDTIKSRALDVKIILSEDDRIKIIKKLLEFHNIETVLDPEMSKLTPGNFILFNYICKENDIFIENNFLYNLSLLLNLYKKNKDTLFINMILYLKDFYFKNLKDKNIVKIDKIIDMKNFVSENLDKYITYNLSQKTLINVINEKLNNE